MALIDQVKAACDRLAPLGWRDLFRQVTANSLDIQQASPQALAAALLKPIPQIDRGFPGFRDFAAQGRQGVTPHFPESSLLYHAFASPAVRLGTNGPLAGFPTLDEIQSVENFVFAAKPRTLAEIRQAAGSKLSVVIFAYEYRSATDTCSQLQADWVFSRTGVSRVGTKAARYNAEHRGFQSEVPEDPFAFHVCPARFGAFLAIKKKGTPSSFLPMRGQPNDTNVDFWIPVHKLFNGPECVKGLTLQVNYSEFHYNDKIRRIQVLLGKNPPTEFPFQFSDEIATLSGSLLIPNVHPRLIEPARRQNKFVTFRVPPATSNFAAFEPGAQQDPQTGAEVRPTPAYVHARTEVRNEVLIDLGEDPARPDVKANVSQGNYDALHYVDFTGEGQIDATVQGLNAGANLNARTIPAYSLVSAPDFFPSAGQRELTSWAASPEVPPSLRQTIWEVPPVSLCDTRLPANLQMPGNRFDPAELGITAVVPFFAPPPSGPSPAPAEDPLRHSCLPDDAAGVFAPGWDVSTDKVKRGTKTIHHLAAYGLGSPFPEDAKLCAALSTFWPTVAPDITRGMSSHGWPTIAPLTDEEIGQTGSLPWDGNTGPKVVTVNGQQFLDCASFLHLDYVRTAMEGRFTSRLTARVATDEFKRRVLAMAFSYKVLTGERNTWFVISFRRVAPGDSELQKAQIDTSTVLTGVVYRFDIFQLGSAPEQVSPVNFRRRRIPISGRRLLLVDPKNRVVLQRRANQTIWARATLNV